MASEMLIQERMISSGCEVESSFTVLRFSNASHGPQLMVLIGANCCGPLIGVKRAWSTK